MTRKQRDTPFHKSRPSSINNAEGSWCGLAAWYRPACEYRFFPFGDQKTPATKYNSCCCVHFAAFHVSLLPRNRFSSAFISFLLSAIGCSSYLFEMLIPRHLNWRVVAGQAAFLYSWHRLVWINLFDGKFGVCMFLDGCLRWICRIHGPCTVQWMKRGTFRKHACNVSLGKIIFSMI